MIEEEYKIPPKVFAIGLLLAFGIFMPLFVIPPLEDVISLQMAISHAQSSLLLTLPVAVLALVAIPSGFLADTIGLKKSIGIGASIVTLGSAFRGISSAYPIVVLFTLIYGLGLGLCFPNIPKLARHCSSKDRSLFLVSLFTAGILASGAVVLSITRPVLFPLTHSAQAAFFICSIPIFVGTILWWPLISDPPCLSAGAESIPVNFAALRTVLTDKDLWLVAVFFWLHNFALYTFVGWLPQYLISKGASSNLAGLIASVTFWVGLPSVIYLSRLSTKLGLRKPFLWGSSIILVFVFCSALFINIPTSWLMVAFAGVATTIRFSTVLTLPVELVNPGLAGMASGLMMSIGYIGALVGPLIAGHILDTTGSYQWVIILLVIVSAVTTAVAFLLPETGPKAAS
jgi:MFS transporter, CP family, cyanate transporter